MDSLWELDVRVLGPLEVRVGGTRLPLGGPKQRTLLGTLLLRPNEVVSTDCLIGALWGEAPVASARAQIQAYVSTLRRLLAGDVILTQPPGYVLRVAADRLDAARFERGVAEARQALAEGRPEAAAAGFREALSLWRGEAFADLETAEARAEAVRLEEVRLTALEERIAADIAVGRHGDVLVELRELVAAHPFRERPRGQLMLALYRSGRRAEALELYRETRRLMVEELGLEPGAELRRLERSMLVGDASLEPRTAAALPAPRQIPMDIPDFTGRAALASAVTSALGEGPVAVLAGPAGIGKTTLAVHVAHRLLPRFPDGQLYANLRGWQARPAEASEVLAGFLHALGIDGAHVRDDDQRAALFRTALAERRMLVVLDDARDGEQVRPLLPGGRGCAVLVTSRARLCDLEGARVLDLELLAPEEALSLFARIAGAARAGAEPEATAEVVRACGGLPLAVRMAGARLGARPRWTVRELADLLADAGRRLDVLRHGERGVRAGLDVSYRALDEPAARAFRLLGLLDGPDVGLEMAAATLEIPLARAEDLLEVLVDVRLLESSRRHRYHFHDLVRLFAGEAAGRDEPACEREAALERAVRFSLSSIERRNRLVRPGRLIPYQDPYMGPVAPPDLGHGDAVAWIEREAPNLRALTFQAAAAPGVPVRLIAGLLAHLGTYLEVQALWSDWESLTRAVLGRAQRDGDRLAEALARHELALLAIHRFRLDEAVRVLDRCLELYREVGDRVGEARALNNLGAVAMKRQEPEAAAAHLDVALEICREQEIRLGEGGILSNLGIAYADRGLLEPAIAHLEAGLAIHRELGNRDGEALALNSLGAAYLDRGDVARAVACQEASLRICRDSGARHNEAWILVDAATAHRLAGRAALAAEEAALARRLCAGVGDERCLALALQELGSARCELDAAGEAREAWRQALAILDGVDEARAADVRRLIAELDAGQAP